MGARSRAKASGCTGKQRHPNAEAARAHLQHLWHRYRYKGRAYHCSFCGFWHVGRHHRKYA